MSLKLSKFLFLISLIHITISIRTPPVINEESLEKIILFNTTRKEINITCKATGNPAPTYKWKLNGEGVRDNVNNVTGQLTITKLIDKAEYQCFALNTWGLAKSNLVVLRKIDFSGQKNETNATVGQPFKLNCNLSIDFLKNVNNYWTLENDNSVNLTATDKNNILDPNGSLWFPNITMSDINKTYVYMLRSENYSYPVCNIILRESKNYSSFNFSDPKNYYVSGKNETAVWNETKKLYCIYYHENSTINVTTKWTKKNEDVTFMAKKSDKYIEIENFKPENEGEYQCEVLLNNISKFNHNFSLKIGTPYFEFKNESEIVYVFENETASIDFEVGGFPNVEIDFTHNETTIVKLDDLYFKQMIFHTKGNNHGINITNLTVKHSGRYGFHVYNDYGFVYKDIFLAVGSPKELTIRRNRIETSSDAGNNITLECSAESFPPANIQWMKLINGSYTPIDRNHMFTGNDNLSLTINNLNNNDTGNYACFAEKDGKKESAFFTLNVTRSENHTNPLPTTNTMPQSKPNPLLLIIILLVIAIVIIIAAVIMYKKSSDSGEYQAAASVEMGSEPGTSASSNPKPKTTGNEIATAEV